MQTVKEIHGNEGISTFDRKINKSKLISGIEECLDSGIRNQTRIATELNCSQSTVNRLMREYFVGLTEIKEESSKASRLIQIGQLSFIHVKAYEAWLESLKDTHEVEVSIHHCGVCNGTGEKDHEDCVDCKGTGEIQSTKTKIKKSTGDPAYLKIAVDCIRQAAKLQGTEIDKSGRVNIQKMIASAREVGGEIEQKVEAMYIEAPIDLILQAKQILSKLEDQKTIEVESEAPQAS